MRFGWLNAEHSDRRLSDEEIQKDGKPAEISYASREQLVEFVPEIADQLRINTDVAFRSVMGYGKDRGWVSA